MLARILSKHIRIKLGGEVYFVAQNVDWDIQQEADDLQEDFLNSERFNTRIRINKIPQFLIGRGLLSSDYDKQLTSLSTQINKSLIGYFLEFNNPVAKKKNATKINNLRSSLQKIRSIVSFYEQFCLENIALRMREDFIFLKTVSDSNNQLIDASLLDEIKVAYYRKMPSINKLRELARTDPWSHIWRVKKSDAFVHLPLSDHQLLLAVFSRMYDGVYESSEKPSNDVIADDDALDGWFLHQSEKSEASSQEKAGTPKKQHAEEVIFLYDEEGKPDFRPERLQEVMNANSEEAKAIQRMRMQQLKNSQTGVIKMGDFKDIKHKQAIAQLQAQNK